MTTFHDMATPHTPTAILLSHLQAAYNVIILTFVIAMGLFPGGVRTQHTNTWRGTRWTAQLLYGHKQRLVNMTCIRPKVFRKLLKWLQLYGDLKDTKLLSAAEKLLIFLIIFSNNSSYRLLSEVTQHSSTTIHQ